MSTIPAPSPPRRRIRRNAPDRYLSADGLYARLAYLQDFIRHAQHHFPAPPPSDFTDPIPNFLLVGAEHGPITAVELDMRGGHQMVGISIHGRNLRWLHPLDYVAVSLVTAYGVPLTLQKTGGGFDYPRFRAFMPAAKGRNIYLLRALADAPPWLVASHLEPIADLNEAASRVDHHYLGRDAIRLRSVREVREEGKESRVPRLGRQALIDAAAHYYGLHADKAEFHPASEVYRMMVEAAFTLADWRHGRADGKPVAATAFDRIAGVSLPTAA
ncbi:hypothetical protein GCM10011390_48590 [Aureimonas endophytica]|uniref:Uncharacterized protein n=1 Tax=Aureimonas endophytica TaxID=2027858 RepID=A0A917ECD3_9HYPH|nr:hypothetical protein [Aureimonas endophytica]GGE23443.1 hypothetical protein GCM10011390_48590 [Aureimonas endophytica]